MTFLTAKSFAKLQGYEGMNSLNVSFSFRTYEEDGLLLFHKFTSPGYVKVCLNLFSIFHSRGVNLLGGLRDVLLNVLLNVKGCYVLCCFL